MFMKLRKVHGSVQLHVWAISLLVMSDSGVTSLTFISLPNNISAPTNIKKYKS